MTSDYFMKVHRHYLFIFLLSFLPFITMFLNPDLPHTSDGAMHLARIASYAKEISGGQFPVRWSSTFNYGYGTPIFNFFHPLPYYITTPFVMMGFNLVTTLKIGFLISYIFSGIGMLMFARAFFGDDRTAFLVTVMYQFAPFRLVEILVRGSLGGIYAYSVVPFILYGITKLNGTKEYKYFFFTAVATALLSISHNIVGVMMFGICILFVFFFSSSRKSMFVSFLSLFTGVALAGYFVIPAILEHKYTLGYRFTKDLFWDHFPKLYTFILPNFINAESLRTAEVAVSIGLFHVLGFGTALFMFFMRLLSKQLTKVTVFTVIIFVVTLFLMQPVSMKLWENISFLRQFQYPWRLLAVINVVTAFIGSVYLSVPLIKKSSLAYAILLVLIIGTTIYYWNPPQGYQNVNEDEFRNYPLSTNYYGEVDLVWSEGTQKSFPDSYADVVAGTATVSGLIRKPIIHSYKVEALTDSTILDRTQFYPGWKVYVDGNDTPIQFQDQNYRGLITYPVTAGTHNIVVKFVQSKIQQFSNAISIGMFILLIIPFFMDKQRRRKILT